MRAGITGAVIAVVILLLVIVGYGSLFTVYQTRQAIVVRLGQPVRIVTEPGLNVKIPLIDRVVYVDKRILDLEMPAQEINAADQKRLVVDAFARFRIQDPLRFYQAVASIEAANARLTTISSSVLRRVLGETSFAAVVRDQRPAIMGRIREQVDNEAQAFGINVVDVRIRRADLPEQNSQAVYQRMQTERQREAAEFRAAGAERSQEIRARADREATIIVANATSRGEQLRGEGDAERNRIFAEAYGKDADFFAFYRAMQAYEAGLRQSDTRMVLKPDSDFFRYFADPSGRPRSNNAPGGSPAPNGNAPAGGPVPNDNSPAGDRAMR